MLSANEKVFFTAPACATERVEEGGRTTLLLRMRVGAQTEHS